MYRLALLAAFVCLAAVGATAQPGPLEEFAGAGGAAADDPTGGAPTDAQALDAYLAGIERAWAGYGRDVHGLYLTRQVACRLSDESHRLRMDTAALRYRLKAAVALAVFARRGENYDQARSALASALTNASNEFTQEASQAWYQDWNSVNSDLQPLYEEGSASVQTLQQHMSQVANDLTRALADPGLAGLRPAVRASIPEAPFNSATLETLEERANEAIAVAFATYADAVATEERASLGEASRLLETYVGDETLLREAIDDVLRRHELRTKDALETLRAECRRAMLALALDDMAGGTQSAAP